MAHSHNGNRDEGVIDLRSSNEEPEFKIGHVEENQRSPEMTKLQATNVTELENAAMKSYDKVKVKFDKFVNLIASHAYEEIFDKHMNDDVIISTDLLTDLANAHEEKTDGKKMPVVLLVGILLGFVVAYLLLK